MFMSSMHGKIILSYVVFKLRMWYFHIVQPCMQWNFLQKVMIILVFMFMFVFLGSKKHVLVNIFLVLYQTHLFGS
jgi:hypothetical protein